MFRRAIPLQRIKYFTIAFELRRSRSLKLKCLPLRMRVRMSFIFSRLFIEHNRSQTKTYLELLEECRIDAFHFINNGSFEYQRECAVHIYQWACISKRTHNRSKSRKREVFPGSHFCFVFFMEFERTECKATYLVDTLSSTFSKRCKRRTVVQKRHSTSVWQQHDIELELIDVMTGHEL